MNNMEKTIAIRGHEKRGVEVINILKQLGGKNSLYLEGNFIGSYYYIDDRGYITAIHTNDVEKINNKNLRTLTLDEYLETLKQTEQIKSTNMEKTIAIQGHKDRGAEVIKILEQLGGRNNHYMFGTDADNIYFIDENNNIDCKKHCTQYQVYTLDEYLETLNQTKQINDKTQRQLSVDIETAKKWYKTNNETLKQLALSVFTEEELTKVEFPTSWEEFCNKYNNVNNECYVNSLSSIDTFKKGGRDPYEDRNLLETQEDAEAILALIQLKRLRDAWWKTLNYQPNWTDNKEEKYCIVIYSDGITLETRSYTNAFLAFPTQESRNQFYTHFKDLILKAKPFLS